MLPLRSSSLVILAVVIPGLRGDGSFEARPPAHEKSSMELSGISTDPPPEDAAFADLDKIDWGLPMLERAGGWVHSGIKYLRPKMELRPSGVFSVFEREIAEGEVLMRIPEHAAISPKMLDDGVWSETDKRRISKLTPEAKIALFLLSERERGADGRWGLLISKVFSTTPAVPPSVEEWSALNKRVKNMYRTVKALATLGNSSWSDAFVALHYAQSRTIALPSGCSLTSDRHRLVVGLDLLNHASNASAVNARVGYARSQLVGPPVALRRSRGYELVLSYAALVSSIPPKVKPCEWWLVKYNFVPERSRSDDPLAVPQLPGVTHPRYTADSELGVGDARGIGESPEWIREIQQRWRSRCLRSYHLFDGSTVPMGLLDCARMERLIVAHLDYIHNDVPSGPTRLIVDAHSDWEEGNMLDWERMEHPMLIELAQSAAANQAASRRILSRVEAGNMTRPDLVDQSLYTLGLERCARENNDSYEKLAKVLTEVSKLDENSYSELLESSRKAQGKASKGWKRTGQSVGMRPLDDGEVEKRMMKHDEL